MAGPVPLHSLGRGASQAPRNGAEVPRVLVVSADLRSGMIGAIEEVIRGFRRIALIVACADVWSAWVIMDEPLGATTA